MSRAVPALAMAAAAVLLLGGCRGAATAGAPTDAPAPSGPVAESAAGQPASSRLADVESTLDRIERELDSDAGR